MISGPEIIKLFEESFRRNIFEELKEPRPLILMEFKFCLTIAAAVLLSVDRVYTGRPKEVYIRSKIRSGNSNERTHFVKALQTENSNDQLTVLCNGSNSVETGTRFTLVSGSDPAQISIQFTKDNKRYALKAKNDNGAIEVVFERQDCEKHLSNQFWFHQTDFTVDNESVLTWESSYLKGMYLGCSADGQERLTLISAAGAYGAPKIQFLITYKKPRMARCSMS